MVAEDTQREDDKNRSKSCKAFEIRDIPDGRGGGAEGFILRNSRKNQTIETDTDWIWLLIKIVEKLEFMKVRAVMICSKTGIGKKVEHRKTCFHANSQ